MIKEREWISVKDKLPERSYKLHLVWVGITGVNSPNFDVAEWDESQQEWYGWTDVLDVTHWMPLPEPPGVDDGI